MKPSIPIFLLLSLAAIYLLSQRYFYPAEEKEEIDHLAEYRKNHPDKTPLHLNVCRTANKPLENSLQPPSLNYRGQSLLSRSTDETDLVLCPGDTFGDLNGTYAILETCYLSMYHQGKLIWSSPKSEHFRASEYLCALSLQRDGSLVSFEETWACFYPVGNFLIVWPMWDSKTGLHPNQTELSIQNQQLQLVQTFQDGSQRLFYYGEGMKGFLEELGAPKQIAEKSLVVNHTHTPDYVILRRNEYIGDLNGTHLILQTHCELLLKENHRTIWSFATDSTPDKECTLNVQGNSIEINGRKHAAENILPSCHLPVVQSNITLQADQLFIIQTLKDGSEITFYSEPGQAQILKMKRELRQVAAENKIDFFYKSDSTDDVDDSDSDDYEGYYANRVYTLERLDYVGDLDGLHLILRDNCDFALSKGHQELWKERVSSDGPFMECKANLKGDGTFWVKRTKRHNEGRTDIQVFGQNPSGFKLSLENNMIVVTIDYQNGDSKIYHANANTNGKWLQFVSASPVTLNNETRDKILQSNDYIGDIHGVFTTLDESGNWILFNKTRVIWESGPTQEFTSPYFYLASTNDGAVAVKYGHEERWSTRSQTVSLFPQAEFSKMELLVNNDGMWLINSFTDGTVDKYKALEGTNRFILM